MADIKIPMNKAIGCCHGDHINWTQASAAQNTWYDVVDSDISDGGLVGVTHDGNGKLTFPIAGTYQISISGTVEANAANKHLDVGIEVDDGGSAEAVSIEHIEIKFANQEEQLGGGSFPLIIAADSFIKFAIRTIDGGTPNLKIDDCKISAVQIA